MRLTCVQDIQLVPCSYLPLCVCVCMCMCACVRIVGPGERVRTLLSHAPDDAGHEAHEVSKLFACQSYSSGAY